MVPLPPTKDLKWILPPRSVPPIVRRAKLMLGTWPALHTVLGVFAVFLSDSISRVIISGMTLPGITLINDVGGFDAICTTHTAIQLWVRFRSVRFTFIVISGTVTYTPGRSLIGTYVWLVVSSETKLAGLLTGAKISQKTKRRWPAERTRKYAVASRRILLKRLGIPSKQARPLCFAEYAMINKARASSTGVIGCRGMCRGQREKRTIHERKCDIDHPTACPWLEVTDPVLIEREVGKSRRFRNLGFTFVSKDGTGDHTRMQHIIDQIGYPESGLCETHKI